MAPDPYTCDVCKAKRIRRPSGLVCPNGHGRIHCPAPRPRGRPKLDVPRAISAGYPFGIGKSPLLFTIEGTEGYFRRLESWPLANNRWHITPGIPIRARDKGHVRKFVPYVKKTR